MRSARISKDKHIDVIPVDSLVNLILTAAWQTLLQQFNLDQTLKLKSKMVVPETQIHFYLEL